MKIPDDLEKFGFVGSRALSVPRGLGLSVDYFRAFRAQVPRW